MKIPDHNFWQTTFTLFAVVGAVWIGRQQNRINAAIHRTQDNIELYATYGIQERHSGNNPPLIIPVINVQNVGTRLIYLEKYVFNGVEYLTDGQVLPSTYSQALSNSYWIELPTNGVVHVAVDVFYSDIEKRRWKSKFVADLSNNVWNLRTLPRQSAG